MTHDSQEIRTLTAEEMRAVRGGRSFWGWVKHAAKWTKDHVVLGLKSIGIKGKF